MINRLKKYLKKTIFINFYIYFISIFFSPKSQNDETLILKTLIKRYNIPKIFIEFGFSGWEFNCSSLINTWEGLLIDGDQYNIKISKIAYPRINSVCKFINLDNIDFIFEFAESKKIGILSIDVDGNDYFFLKKLISIKPALIIAEYNSSFGLRPISVEYDPTFDRRNKHPSWMYYGASLKALSHLAEQNDYSLIEVSNSGVNAFFIRNNLLNQKDIVLNSQNAFKEKKFPDKSHHYNQWKIISNLPYLNVLTHKKYSE